MKYIVCDDEQFQMDILCKYIHEYAQAHHLEIEILKYTDCDNLWWDLQNGLVADLLLLDIQMENMTGIELARKMRQAHLNHLICFISGVKDFVFEGYDVDALAYLLKPYEKDQLFKILDKAIKQLHISDEFSIISSKKEVYKIYHRDVIGVEALGHETKIYLRSDGMSGETTIIIKQSIREVLEMLHMPLLQIHRSFAVNMKNIVRVTKKDCIGEDGIQFPIARGNYEMCMQEFIAANRGAL